MLVTVVGIILSAWLIPAFTRQWDDRQKAHDLKASLVAEMASATARALADKRADVEDNIRSHSPIFSRSERIMAAEREWSVASLRIQAKFWTYFSLPAKRTEPALADFWRAYSELVSETLGTEFPLPGSTLGRTSFVVVDASEVQGALRNFRHQRVGCRRHAPASRELFCVFSAYGDLEYALLGLQALITSQVLTSHPIGYSTTWRDLLRDLIP